MRHLQFLIFLVIVTIASSGTILAATSDPLRVANDLIYYMSTYITSNNQWNFRSLFLFNPSIAFPPDMPLHRFFHLASANDRFRSNFHIELSSVPRRGLSPNRVEFKFTIHYCILQVQGCARRMYTLSARVKRVNHNVVGWAFESLTPIPAGK
ncbi:unnamed protein product [Caenorhabditis bovis]|uniref:Uncharacterized protein n=1 Tax=Caenorhabditis bovis TaxID=2654633 RepID=A0A8S1EQU8_9PELO|nr:unnamed protein product [Caenorhabditis bovis]